MLVGVKHVRVVIVCGLLMMMLMNVVVVAEVVVVLMLGRLCLQHRLGQHAAGQTGHLVR